MRDVVRIVADSLPAAVYKHNELEEENIMTIAVICTALLALLIFVLGFSVSLARSKTDTISGFKNESTDPLYKLIRAHGNTTEYVPILAVLMLYLGATAPSAWITWTMIVVTLARFLMAAGLVFPADMDKPNGMRFMGAILTYLGGMALAVAAVLSIA